MENFQIKMCRCYKKVENPGLAENIIELYRAKILMCVFGDSFWWLNIKMKKIKA